MKKSLERPITTKYNKGYNLLTNKTPDGILDRKNNKAMIFLNVKKFINSFLRHSKTIYFNVFPINIELHKRTRKHAGIQ